MDMDTREIDPSIQDSEISNIVNEIDMSKCHEAVENLVFEAQDCISYAIDEILCLLANLTEEVQLFP
ncbi:hypothetical protein QJS10_CPA05g01582 [Acorus calamus]|uniref:Uncharacterized protein n=1 Tax=Acorus calamus TaxID=4465 RepID=A0AAV9EPV5_ACOCL|nr:hypothetical protein QJS10_CPA05g01582 [Acorus calamus]